MADQVKGYDHRDGGDFTGEEDNDNSCGTDYGWEPKEDVLKMEVEESTLDEKMIFTCPGSRSWKYVDMFGSDEIQKRHDIVVTNETPLIIISCRSFIETLTPFSETRSWKDTFKKCKDCHLMDMRNQNAQ